MNRFRHSGNRIWAAAVLLAAAVLFAIGVYLLPWFTRGEGDVSHIPGQAVERAWQRARELGIYHFTTDLETTISSTGRPVPENSARHERLYLEGQVNLPAQKIELTMWERGGIAFNTRQGIQVRIQEGKAYGRVGSGEWQATMPPAYTCHMHGISQPVLD
jgi:hypothetical protein